MLVFKTLPQDRFHQANIRDSTQIKYNILVHDNKWFCCHFDADGSPLVRNFKGLKLKTFKIPHRVASAFVRAGLACHWSGIPVTQMAFSCTEHNHSNILFEFNNDEPF